MAFRMVLRMVLRMMLLSWWNVDFTGNLSEPLPGWSCYGPISSSLPWPCPGSEHVHLPWESLENPESLRYKSCVFSWFSYWKVIEKSSVIMPSDGKKRVSTEVAWIQACCLRCAGFHHRTVLYYRLHVLFFLHSLQPSTHFRQSGKAFGTRPNVPWRMVFFYHLKTYRIVDPMQKVRCGTLRPRG